MGITHSSDHEILVGSTTERLKLMRDENGHAMYSVIEEVPEYRNPLTFTQTNWIGGHGQYDAKTADMYFDGKSIDSTLEGKVILAPLLVSVQEDDASALDGNVLGFCWSPTNSKLMCWTATNIYRLDSDGWEICTTAVAAVTDMVEYNGILYAAVTYATKYYYSSDATAWTQTDLTDGYADYFLVAPNADGTQDVLWKSKYPNEVSETTDGRTVAAGGVQYSSANYIGDTSTSITNLFLHNNLLMIGKKDSLWNLDGNGGTHNLRPEMKTNVSTNNFKYVTQWQTGTYHSEGTQLGEMVSVKYEPMGALYGIDDIGKEGSTVGLAADRDYMYQAVDEGTNTIIYRIREKRVEDSLRWERCPFVFLGTTACSNILVVPHSETDRRLWFTYGTATGYVSLSDNPTANSSYNYVSSGTMRMSYSYGTNPYWDKMFQSVVTQTKNCSTYSTGGTVTDVGSARCNGSPVSLSNGANTITVTVAGDFTVVLPTGSTGTAVSGTCTVSSSPLALAAGSQTVTITGTGTFTIYADTISVTPYYYKNMDTTRTALTAAIVTNGTIKTNLTSAISCNRISFEVDLASNDPYKTPELQFFQTRGIEKPETIRTHECVYSIGDEPSNRAESIRTFLRNARTSTSLIKFADLRYNDSTVTGYTYVIVPPGYPQEVEVVGEVSRSPEIGIRMRWQEVSYS
jgi:hypothetical protein